MTPSAGPIQPHQPGASSRVIQGFFPGGRPRIVQASPAPVAPVRPPVPAPVQARPASPPAPLFPGRPATGALQPALRPGQPPRPILSTRVQPDAVQPATPLRPQVTQPILPPRATPTAVQPRTGNAFPLPGNLALKPRGSGQPLPEPIQKKMEAFFNTSFADVRVHVGHEASSIGALAFTHGSDLYFAPGQYNPQSTHGQQLLGHELTHVLQQRSGRVRNPLGSGVAVVQDPALEAEAERMGLRAAAAAPPIQAKPAATGPVAASLQAAGIGPNAVAANGAILPARSLAHVSVQRKPGPLLPGRLPASAEKGPATFFSAIQRYTLINNAKAKLAASGDVILTDKGVLFATEAKIDESNRLLALAGPHGSLIKLVKTGEAKTTEEAAGKVFFQVMPGLNLEAYRARLRATSHSFHAGMDVQGSVRLQIWADCRRASEVVTGSSTSMAAMDRRVNIGGELHKPFFGELVRPSGVKNDSTTARLAFQVYALGIPAFLEELFREHGDGALKAFHRTRINELFPEIEKMEGGEVLGYMKRIIGEAKSNISIAERLYTSLGKSAKEMFHKKMQTNEFANPEIGAAYSIVTEYGMPDFAPTGDDWAFHWGGVVMKGGTDNVTLENLSVSDEKVRNEDWFFAMYGTSDPDQSFHRRYMATRHHGNVATTIAVVTEGSGVRGSLPSSSSPPPVPESRPGSSVRGGTPTPIRAVTPPLSRVATESSSVRSLPPTPSLLTPVPESRPVSRPSGGTPTPSRAARTLMMGREATVSDKEANLRGIDKTVIGKLQKGDRVLVVDERRAGNEFSLGGLFSPSKRHYWVDVNGVQGWLREDSVVFV